MNEVRSETGLVRQSILVLGMHRSGTSALAGTLGLAGVELGNRLVSGREDNPKGFFEHEAVWQIHDDLLNELGSNMYDIRPLQAGWTQKEPATRARERLRAELEKDFPELPLWGVKDPRLSRTFPLWPALLRELNVVPKIILALRHPMEVATSLRKRDNLGEAHALALWLRYTLDAERNTRGFVRTVQYYPDLIADWRSELERLQFALSLSLPQPFNNAAITEFLDPRLRHQILVSNDGTGIFEPYAHWCHEAFDALKAFDKHPQQSQKILDSITAEFDSALERALQEQIGHHLRQITFQREVIQILEAERGKLISWAKQEETLRASLECEIEVAKSLIYKTKEQLQAKTDEIERLYRSRSWRWTAPLRAMLRGVKKWKSALAANGEA